jgi:hypothetical protein
VVLDGRINLGREPSQFGLGLLRDTLHDESLRRWVRIVVDVALRDGRPFVNQFDGPVGRPPVHANRIQGIVFYHLCGKWSPRIART